MRLNSPTMKHWMLAGFQPVISWPNQDHMQLSGDVFLGSGVRWHEVFFELPCSNEQAAFSNRICVHSISIVSHKNYKHVLVLTVIWCYYPSLLVNLVKTSNKHPASSLQLKLTAQLPLSFIKENNINWPISTIEYRTALTAFTTHICLSSLAYCTVFEIEPFFYCCSFAFCLFSFNLFISHVHLVLNYFLLASFFSCSSCIYCTRHC